MRSFSAARRICMFIPFVVLAFLLSVTVVSALTYESTTPRLRTDFATKSVGSAGNVVGTTSTILNGSMSHAELEAPKGR